MSDITPSTWLGSGFSVDTVNHLIKFNTNNAATNKLLKQLTDAQASTDIRQIVLAFCEAIYQANRTQFLADNKVLQMNISRSGNPDFTSGGFFMQYTISLNFTDVGTWTVVPES
jgi:hypothetical protein